MVKKIVIPADAGIQVSFYWSWIPGQARNDKLYTTYVVMYKFIRKIKKCFEDRGYKDISSRVKLDKMNPGIFAFRFNVLGLKEDHKPVNIPWSKPNLPVILPMSTRGGPSFHHSELAF
jgi:hypothetical protein